MPLMRPNFLFVKVMSCQFFEGLLLAAASMLRSPLEHRLGGECLWPILGADRISHRFFFQTVHGNARILSAGIENVIHHVEVGPSPPVDHQLLPALSGRDNEKDRSGASIPAKACAISRYSNHLRS